MTVKELIEALQELPQDAKVGFDDGYGYLVLPEPRIEDGVVVL